MRRSQLQQQQQRKLNLASLLVRRRQPGRPNPAASYSSSSAVATVTGGAYGAAMVCQYRWHSSSSSSHGRGRAMGSHAQSKASGREDAFHSPLRFDESVRDRMSATSGSGGSMRFGSIRTRGAPEMEATQGEPTPPPPIAVASSSSSIHSPSPLVLPYSALAYRSRLQHARLASLAELVDAPYAPSPLRVMMDMFAAVARLQRLTDGQGSSAVHGREAHGTVNDASATAEAAAAAARLSTEEREEMTASLHRLTSALSRSRDVERVLALVTAAAADAVTAADVIGDRESLAGLQATGDLAEEFASAVLSLSSPVHDRREDDETTEEHGNNNRSGGGGGVSVALFPTVGPLLPPATRAALLRGVLGLCEATGSRVTAVSALEELISLSQRAEVVTMMGETARHHHRSGEEEEKNEDGSPNERDDDENHDEVFSLDDVVSLVDAEMQSEFMPVTVRDHLAAVASCGRERDFDLAISLYRRLVQHAQAAGSFAVSVRDMSAALTALASCSRTSVHFAELQSLIIASEAAQTVPVSVPLYTALIDAVSRATDNPARMQVALALYRRLRDGQLTPTAATYATLMACCASTSEPTQAFAFYQEARHVCGVDALTPQVYTNLLLAYANAGYGADARRTLDVLVEAGAPLTRPAFHAVLAAAVTYREAAEVLALMTDRYRIAATPNSYGLLAQAAAKEPNGSSTILQLFDLHEGALESLLDISGGERSNTDNSDDASDAGGGEGAVAASSSPLAVDLERRLVLQFPHYARSIEHALLKLPIDPSMDPRLQKYMAPLARTAQLRMNDFIGGFAPQAPTRIPAGADACIAVLAADALANLDAFVEPFVGYYSAIVIPYSALAALQRGSGRRVPGMSVKGGRAGLHDAVWAEAGNERGALVEHRRRRLQKFLIKYREVVHLVSLEEELRWARDTRRYGIPVSDWMARSAAFAINLARRDVPGGTKLYADHKHTSIVLVSANYNKCGRYIVDLKRTYLSSTVRKHQKSQWEQTAGLREGLQRVFYHNPRTRPAWTPPRLSIQATEAAAPPRLTATGGGGGGMSTSTADTHLRDLPALLLKKKKESSSGINTDGQAASGSSSNMAAQVALMMAVEGLSQNEAEQLYRQQLAGPGEEEREPHGGTDSNSTTATGGVAVFDRSDELALDADLLMAMMDDD